MAGIKDYTSMNYYSNVNNRVKFRTPSFFSKSAKYRVNHKSASGTKQVYKEESIGFKLLRFTVLVLLFSVIALIAYINFSYFVAVL